MNIEMRRPLSDPQSQPPDRRAYAAMNADVAALIAEACPWGMLRNLALASKLFRDACAARAKATGFDGLPCSFRYVDVSSPADLSAALAMMRPLAPLLGHCMEDIMLNPASIELLTAAYAAGLITPRRIVRIAAGMGRADVIEWAVSAGADLREFDVFSASNFAVIRCIASYGTRLPLLRFLQETVEERGIDASYEDLLSLYEGSCWDIDS
jgi:hypothetical protein